MILDSGNRREFDTGAVRDIEVGKGRCDLMPLSVAAKLLAGDELFWDGILLNLSEFMERGRNNTDYLYLALKLFAEKAYQSSVPDMLLDVSKHFEEGALKYGENNWQKGIPVNCYIDSAVRHYLKWCRGDKDENHHRAFVWNVMCCCWEVNRHA